MSNNSNNNKKDIFGDEFSSKPESDFSSLFENSMQGVGKRLEVGQKIRCEILSVGKEEVFVATGTLNDGVVLRKELTNEAGEFLHKIGDALELYVIQAKGSDVRLSPKPTAKNLAEDLEDAYDLMQAISGTVTEAVNGGFRVQLKGKLAFCPISQMDSKRIDKPEEYIGKKFDFMITKWEGGRNIVVSRRKFLDEERHSSEAAVLDSMKIGQLVSGVITRVEKFGAFVEIAPSVDGLVHVSELRWSRVSDPAEVVRVGDQVQAKILKIEEESGRLKISLSIKQAEGQPWERLPAEIQVGKVITGKVTRCLKFGAFVEVIPGIEGLVPLSEMSYTKRVVRSDELFKEGDSITVLIKEVNTDDRKLLLSLKDAGNDPWAMVGQKYPEGTVHKAKVTRKEPYGLFLQLEEGIVGLLPKSKANENPEFPFEKLKIGDEATIQIAEIKWDDRKIGLTVPQDPDAESWKGFSSGTTASSFGTLGDQFKSLLKKS